MTIFEFVKSQVTLESVASAYVQLKPAGAYLKGSCPFHSETDASFTISVEKKIYYCFGCHAHGDVIAFVAQIDNCGQKEAVNKLIEQYQLTVPENIARGSGIENAAALEEKRSYFKLCQLTAQWCENQLKTDANARAYITARGVTDAMIDLFKIGFFPGGYAAMSRYTRAMAAEGILIKDLIAAGICVEGDRSIKSPFEDRIIFPIIDHYGRYCGFGGRVFLPGDTRPKYYNSKESPHFIKGQLLYNFEHAKKAIQEKQYAFLVEGYTDCIALVQYGYSNVVATLGTACTRDHLERLARVAETVYVMYDGDNAGQKAIMRLTELCWELSLELFVLILPQGVDPAEHLSAHENLDTLFAARQDIFQFFVTREARDFAKKTLAAQCQSVDKILALIKSVPHVVKQELLLQRAARSLDLPIDTLRTYFETGDLPVQKQKGGESRAQISSSGSVSGGLIGNAHQGAEKITRHEELLVAAVVQQGESFSISDEVLKMMGPETQKLLEKVRKPCPHTSEQMGGYSCDHCLALTLSEQEKENLDRYRVLPHGILSADDFQSLLTSYVQKNWKTVVTRLRHQIREAEARGASADVTELMRRFSHMKHHLETKGFLHDEKE